MCIINPLFHPSDVDITFPTAEKAALVCAVLQVDDELQPNKITKTFTQEGPILHMYVYVCMCICIIPAQCGLEASPLLTDFPIFPFSPLCQKSAFVSKDAKVLRVAISSFYDMLTVSLKTLREFDDDGN